MRVGGYVRLHRKLKQWGWYSDANTMRVFLHLLLSANYEPSDFHGTRIETGQAAFGRLEMASALHLTEQQVRTALLHLQQSGEITVSGNNRFSLATITKWTDYQYVDSEINQQITEKLTNSIIKNQPTDNQLEPRFDAACRETAPTESTNGQPTDNGVNNQPITTSKKKEDKKEETLDVWFAQFWQAYPRKDKKKASAVAWRNIKWGRMEAAEKLFQKIMAAVERGKTSVQWSRDNGKYIPMPTTWIHDERWNDGAHTEQPAQQRVDLSALEVK